MDLNTSSTTAVMKRPVQLDLASGANWDTNHEKYIDLQTKYKNKQKYWDILLLKEAFEE